MRELIFDKSLKTFSLKGNNFKFIWNLTDKERKELLKWFKKYKPQIGIEE